jgi:hypothetical protein
MLFTLAAVAESDEVVEAARGRHQRSQLDEVVGVRTSPDDEWASAVQLAAAGDVLV